MLYHMCIMIQWLMIIDTYIPMHTITELKHFRDQRHTLYSVTYKHLKFGQVDKHEV